MTADAVARLPPIPERDGALVRGYEVAANVLLSLAAGLLGVIPDDAGVHLMAPPIVYLFRHALELKLKFYIRGLEEHLGKTRSEPKEHDLRRLWARYAELVVEHVPEMRGDARLEVARRFFEEFQDDDRESTAFRYSTDRAGQQQLAKFDAINVGRFGDSARTILRFLENPIKIALTRTEDSGSS